MKKEVWGVNVIGNQGVNAINDFSIRPSDDGTDVIVSINGSELSGEEFAELKEIAETGGGGGTPDAGDAVNDDVLSVKVTPGIYKFDPPIAVGDDIPALYALSGSMIDFSALEYNDDRFASMLGVNVCTLLRGTATIEDEGNGNEIGVVSFSLIAFRYQGIDLLMAAMGPTPEEEEIESDFFYASNWDMFRISSAPGWLEMLPTEDGFVNLSYLPFENESDHNYHYTLSNISLVAFQDVWGAAFGKSMNVVEVTPETKEVIWSKPYPKITNPGKVLMSVGEGYSLIPDDGEDNITLPRSGGKFYFNIELDDETIRSYITPLGSGELSLIIDTDVEGYMICFDLMREVGASIDSEAIIFVLHEGEGDDIITPIYSTATGHYNIPGTGEIDVVKGWNQTGIDLCGWSEEGMLYFRGVSTSDIQEVARLYGSIITIQEGIFYGDVKNAGVEWQDANTEVKPDDYETTNASNTSYLMVEDNNGKMKRLNYNDTKPTSGTLTLYSSSWTASGDEFYQTISLDQLGNDDTIMIAPYNKTYASYAQDANIYFAEANGTELKFYCSTQPSNDIKLKYTIIKG